MVVAVARICVIVVLAVMVRMAVFMGVGAPVTISAAFGREGLLHLSELRAELFEHGPDHMIALDQQPGRLDLAGGVAVSDVPGHSRQMIGGDLQKWLWGRNHTDLAAAFEQQDTIVIK